MAQIVVTPDHGACGFVQQKMEQRIICRRDAASDPRSRQKTALAVPPMQQQRGCGEQLLVVTGHYAAFR
jgi:hypothetical protein